MAQPLMEPPLHLSGAGWTAQVHHNHIVVQTTSEWDALPDAVHALLNPAQRHLWSVMQLGEDDEGWDVWLLERDSKVSTW